jgi:hypothetical protein
MALAQSNNQVSLPAIRCLLGWMIVAVLCAASCVPARAQDAQPSHNQSWTATKQTSVANTNPLRTIESHSMSGDRKVDKQTVEVLGPDGRYQASREIETETIRINATTTRTVVRMYNWDAQGQRNLAQLTEEEVRTSSSGDAHVVRTTSSRDVNGNLQFAHREVADTKKTSPDAQETRTTTYLADGNGGFAPSQQTQESQKRRADQRIEVKKTMLFPGANGNWELGEVREKTITENGKSHTTEESVSRPDSEGKLSEIYRTVGEETENAAGEKSDTVETYSTQVPGLPVDGSLHPSDRVTTVQNSDSNGKITEQQVEQPNTANPSDGLQVNGRNKYTVKYAASGSGATETKTVQVRGANGTFNVISVETQKSEQIPEPLAKASSDNPK